MDGSGSLFYLFPFSFYFVCVCVCGVYASYPLAFVAWHRAGHFVLGHWPPFTCHIK